MSCHLRRLIKPALALLCSTCFPCLAQAVSETERPLQEVIVKGQWLEGRHSAFSSTRFSAEQIQAMDLSMTQDLFEQVPGMSLRRLGLPGVADNIVIRGFGGGGHGGDLGAVIDGIPLNEAMSHADGYVDFNVIVPLEIALMEVYRGPVSTLYGNYNRGGLIRIDTRSGGDYTHLDATTGSNGLVDLQAAHGMAIGDSQQLNVAMQHFRHGGFRPQSATEHSTLAGRWQLDLNERTDLALSGRWHQADSEGASYLTREQFERSPYTIDPNVQNDGADKHFVTLRADLNHSFSDTLRLLTFAYATEQDFTRWFTRPVGTRWQQREESYERQVQGAGFNLNGQAGQQVQWVAGLEHFRERTDFRFYDDLAQRQRVHPAIDDRITRLDSLSAFAESQVELHPLLQPSIGLRYDRFSGACRLAGEESGNNPCTALNALDNLSPKAGIRSQWTESVQSRISWSEGFALPNGWVKYQAEGASLDPVIFRQQEIGLTWTPLDRTRVDLAFFQLRSSGEVRTLAPGEFENYGKTERRGLEMTLEWQARDSLNLSAVYSRTDTEVLRSDTPALEGNEVGGVPAYSATFRADWQFLPGWRVDANWRAVGGFALNNTNTAYSDSYALLDLGLSYSPPGRASWRYYLRGENISGERFAPNQLFIGGQELFSVGAPRQIRVGAALSL